MRTFSNVTLAHRKSIAVLLACILALALVGFSGPVAAGQSSPSARPEPSAPQATCPPGGQCFADVLPGSPFYDYTNSLYRDDVISGYACGGPGEPCDAQNRPYYRPGSDVTRAQMSKFVDNARHLPGISIDTDTDPQPIYANTGATNGIGIEGIHGSFVGTAPGVRGGTASFSNDAVGVLGLVAPTNPGTNSAGVRGINNGTGNSGIGVYGSHAGQGVGVRGSSATGTGVSGSTGGTGTTAAGVSGSAGGAARGVVGLNNNVGAEGTGVQGIHQGGGEGVTGTSVTGVGVYGYSAGNDGGAMGVFGSNQQPNGYAGYFLGRARVTGDLIVDGDCTGCTGPSKIDHPLDPENKYLYHSAVKSQDMMNIYNGNVTLDDKGEAVVQMPEWFEALNQEFRYQLTAIGAPGPNLYIAEEIKDNHFKIGGGKTGMKVSWMVTGIRHDPYSEQHPTPVEADKSDEERGLYVHPEAYGQPDSKQVGNVAPPPAP